jgi:hypothetical protein
MRSWRITIIRRGQVTSVGAILPSVQESPQVPVDRRAVAVVRAELARRDHRTATDADRGSRPERVASIKRKVPRAADLPENSRSS